MKILLINDNLGSQGGAERAFWELKERLTARQQYHVAVLGFGNLPCQTKDMFVLPALRSQIAKLLWRLCIHPFIYRKLRRFIVNYQPDVIHLHNIKQYTPSLLYALRGYPVVHTVHDFSHLCPTAQNLHRDGSPCQTGIRAHCFWQHRVKYRRLTYLILALSFYKTRRQLLKTVRTFISPSPLLTDYLEKNGFSPVVTIPHFKNDTVIPDFQQLSSTDFLFAGNLDTHKGIFPLLEGFALAVLTMPNLMLHIAGTGPQKDALMQFAEKLKITQHVRFLGWQTDLTPLYHRCCALIFPSTGLESFGLVITEAMNHGRAVIGANRGTVPWLVADQRTGLLFDPLHPHSLAEKICYLARNKDIAITLGKQAREEIVQKFNNAALLNRTLALAYGR